MAQKTIDRLIINSPYEEPAEYWRHDRETRLFERMPGRRPAGYIVASARSQAFDDPGEFVEIPLVNRIRPRVAAWREAGYPGVTGITRRLLDHWYNLEERDFRRFFFCQLEAIETLIWLVEGPPAEHVGIDIASDGGPFRRLCCKMATGSGKTVVMAMLIAWQVINKATYPNDARFSRHVFIVAPGLTIRNRLAVLQPSNPENYYDEFNVVPPGLGDALRQGRLLIRNWHALQWETAEQLGKRRSVDKRGPKSDEAYTREVLEELSRSRNLVVINDEAHHAWRMPAESVRGIKKDEIEAATVWISGLDRIHNTRGILNSFDFSATPFAPTGKRSSPEALFDWIVSDFGLNDAIEAGLVKTPRVVVRDDGTLTREYKSRFYHIYRDPEVQDDINRRAEPHEPLPQLVMNAYYLLGKDWRETRERWEQQNIYVPPVMITVANRTETAARIKCAFDQRKILIPELCESDRLLHIDSRVLAEAESQDEAIALDVADEDEDDVEEERPLTRKELAELLRQQVDTVGKIGAAGEQIQNVISVGMLSEGWDAKTVTHIMGLRAFSSQLLCEQVVGRGLRRTSYDVNPITRLFDPEYVNIFGIPFTFLPHEPGDGSLPDPTAPRFRIEPLPQKRQFEIAWPNVLRVEHTYRPLLELDLERVKPLQIDVADIVRLAQLAPILDGKPDMTQLSEIDLENMGREFRMQRIAFETARDIFDQMKPTWAGNREYLLAQVIHIVERVLQSDRITLYPPLWNEIPIQRRIALTLSMTRIVQHIWEAIRCENTESIELVLDSEHPIRSTGDMPVWYTGRPCEITRKSHINMCVYDSTWEASEAFELEQNPMVDAWVKNDHLGFHILYIYNGAVRKYWPDFIVRLADGSHLVLETKGQDTQQDRTKREFLDEWVRAVNINGGFDVWKWAVSTHPSDLRAIIQ